MEPGVGGETQAPCEESGAEPRGSGDLRGSRPDLRALSPLTYAFVGDAFYELAVRTMLAREANRPAHELNRRKVKLVKAGAQARIYEALTANGTVPENAENGPGAGEKPDAGDRSGSAAEPGNQRAVLRLTEEESDILRRGRNAHPSNTARGASVAEYRKATAVEALIGYLSLSGRGGRAMEIIEYGLRQIKASEA